MNEPQLRKVLIGFRMVESLRDVLQGVATYVKKNGLRWEIQCADLDHFGSLLQPHIVNGAIASVLSRDELKHALEPNPDFPIVNMLCDLSQQGLPSVLSDNVEFGRVVARELIGRGFTRLAYVGWAGHWSDNRLRGFEEALRGAGPQYQFLGSFHTSAQSYRHLGSPELTADLAAWLRDLPKPVAIFAGSDMVSRTVLRSCDVVNLRVPNDVAIMGVDNIVPYCELASVPLSTVAQDFPSLGFEAARLLDLRFRGETIDPMVVVIPPGEIAVRRSTDVLAFGDEHVNSAMKLIHQRGLEGLGMKDILRTIPVSRRWLDERFKQLVGHTPSEEVRRFKLSQVRELLIYTDMPVKQIAKRCGFSRTQNMVRSFGQAYGMPPQMYRTKFGRSAPRIGNS